jgi:Tfp pilus assembly protein PilZ
MSDTVVQNKRKSYRKSCYLVTDFSVNGRAYAGYLRDISIEGVFLETKVQAQVGDAVILLLTYHEFPKPFKFSGEIVRISSRGIAVAFDKHRCQQNEKLQVLVDRIKGGWI